MLKQVILARFEPVLTEFSPFHNMHAPLCALRTYLRAVWCSHLVNKQQASNKQARHHSVLAIAPSQRLGLDSTSAILEPRWCPSQIQVLSRKLTRGARGRGRHVGRCPPKSVHFVPQNSLFWPKTAPKPSENGQTRQMVAALHLRLDCPVTKSPFLPSICTICPGDGPIMAKNGLNVRCSC